MRCLYRYIALCWKKFVSNLAVEINAVANFYGVITVATPNRNNELLKQQNYLLNFILYGLTM